MCVPLAIVEEIEDELCVDPIPQIYLARWDGRCLRWEPLVQDDVLTPHNPLDDPFDIL